MITAYSWATGIFQQTLPASLTDAEKRAELVYKINSPLIREKNGLSADIRSKIWIAMTKITALIK